MFRRKLRRSSTVEVRREPVPEVPARPAVLHGDPTASGEVPQAAAATQAARPLGRPVEEEVAFLPSRLTFFVRLTNVPSEAEFSRLCSRLKEQGVDGIFLPRLGDLAVKNRTNLLRQLAFLVRTFGLHPIWPLGSGDDLATVRRSCTVVELLPTLYSRPEVVAAVCGSALKPLLQHDGRSAVSELVAAAQSEGTVLSVPASREDAPQEVNLGTFVTLSRRVTAPLVVDCSQAGAANIDQFALSAVTAGACGIVVGLHFGAAYYGQSRAGITLDEFIGVRARLQALKNTLNVLGHQGGRV